MITWHRTTIQNTLGVPVLVYYTDERDWAAWSIDREPTSNGSRTNWYEYQVKYHGEKSGARHRTLHNAKRHVERTGRKP
jgi:hypothetical protein